MNVTAIRHAAVLAAGVLLASPPAWSGSAMDVFEKAAPSIVVVLGLDKDGSHLSQGSGVIVGGNEVVTNCHVVHNAAGIAVRAASGQSRRSTRRMTASLLVRREQRDLCLLFVEELSKPPAVSMVRLGSATALSVGQEVYAIGAPSGLELSLSRGIVSQLRRVSGEKRAPVVQTDAAMSPGSSGGGLFNRHGELVGITTFKWWGESLNFALPVEWVKELQNQGSWRLAAARLHSTCIAKPNFKCVITLALGAAYEIDGNDCDALRIGALSDIAVAQLQAGDKSSAKQTLAQATSECATAQPETGLGIVDILRATDGFADILRNASNAAGASMDSRSLLRGLTLSEIARAQAQAGLVDQALETANAIADSTMRETAFRDIAVTQAHAGDSDGAFETVMKIDDTAMRAWTLGQIAIAQGDTGRGAMARQTLITALEAAQSIDDASHRAESLGGIARAQLKTGYRETAQQTLALAVEAARIISDASHRSEVLSRLGADQARAGDLAAALETVSSVHDPFSLASAFRHIALVLVRAGRMPLARQTVTAALEVAKTIVDPYNRVESLSRIAVAQAKTGQGQMAKHTFAAAVETRRDIGNAHKRAAALELISREQAEAGHIIAAFEAARRIGNASRRESALVSIATAQAQANNFTGAMDTATSIDTASERARALTNVAMQLKSGLGVVTTMENEMEDNALSSSWSADTRTAYQEHLSSLLSKFAATKMKHHPRVEESLKLTRWERRLVQRALAASNIDVGPADGIFGQRTRTGLRAWQAVKGVDETGYLTCQQAETLITAGREQSLLLGLCSEDPQSPSCHDGVNDEGVQRSGGSREKRCGAKVSTQSELRWECAEVPQTTPGTDKAQEERLAEFCAEVPYSALCSDVKTDESGQRSGGSRERQCGARVSTRSQRLAYFEMLAEYCAEFPQSALCRDP